VKSALLEPARGHEHSIRLILLQNHNSGKMYRGYGSSELSLSPFSPPFIFDLPAGCADLSLNISRSDSPVQRDIDSRKLTSEHASTGLSCISLLYGTEGYASRDRYGLIGPSQGTKHSGIQPGDSAAFL
jgi:hypothetical protein